MTLRVAALAFVYQADRVLRCKSCLLVVNLLRIKLVVDEIAGSTIPDVWPLLGGILVVSWSGRDEVFVSQGL
jgi:hypothetical protein